MLGPAVRHPARRARAREERFKITGIRKTGDIYLAEECIGRITEDLHDLRCVGCGTKARRAAVTYTPQLKFEPVRKGKKLAA